MTVFSSSHYCGGDNKAAAILAYDRKLRLIIKKRGEEKLEIQQHDIEQAGQTNGDI